MRFYWQRATARRRDLVLSGLAMVLVTACSPAATASPSAQEATAATSASVAPSSAPPEVEEVSVLFPFPPASIPYFQIPVAEDQGFFAGEGIALDIQVADGSGQVIQQVVAGNAQWGFAGASATISASANNPNLRAYSCHTVGQIFRVVTPAGSSVQQIEDLRGKRFGVSDLSGGEIPIVNAILSSRGLTPGQDVELIAAGDASAALSEALESGSIDAYSSGYDQIAAVRASGVELRDITPDDFGAVPSTCMMTTSEVLQDPAARETAAAIARAWAKASAYAVANPDEALAATCTAVPEACENAPLADEIFKATVELVTTDDPSFPHGKIDVDAWKLAAQILADAGTTPTLVDVLPIIDSPEIREIQAKISQP
jgi:NitT/TauT family transport system substrate-binding protein